MAEVDTSSYTQGRVKPLNPLETLSGAANLQSTLNQNRLFQQQYQTNLAVSRIYKEAMKPDGTIDQAKLSALLAADPSASYGLPQAYQGSQEAAQRNINIDTSKLENAQKHLQALSGYLAPLVKPGATSADVSQALAHAVTNGMANTEEASRVWSTLPRGPNGQVDESKIPAWAQQQQLNVMSAQERLNAMSPAPQMVDTGQSLIPMRMPQVGQPSLAGPGIQKELPPTTQRFNPQTNQMEFVGSGGSGGVAPGSSQSIQVSGGGGLAAAPPLGAPEAAAETGRFSATQGNTLQGRADRVTDNKAILGNLEGELGDFTTGPGTESVAKFKKFVNAQLGTNFDGKGLASREQFNKLAGMLAQSQFQALGGTGTDAKLDATTLTSPNSELSKMGNKGIIALLKGNEDAIAAKNQAWQQWQQSHGPQSYGQFSTEFNKKYDPRVFQTQYLSPDDNKKMLSGMTKQEQKAFLNNYRTALSNGWVKLPGAQ